MNTRTIIVVALSGLAIAACTKSAPPPPPAPVALTDSAAAALRWVDAHALAISPSDSVETAEDRARAAAIAGDARIIGVSELTEGTHQFPILIRRLLFALADTVGVKGLAIQAPMPEAMELDRYVRTGVGDPRRLLRTLGSTQWETQEMLGLVAAMRGWNQSHATDKQLGFYGFEIPTAEHALHVITTLPDSEMGASLNAWLRGAYTCVSQDEAAHWGLEGRAADSTFWNRCRGVTVAALDSVTARLRAVPSGSRAASDLAFAQEMADLVKHHVDVGLRHLPRHEGVAAHTMYLANRLGADAKLLVWGGDVEIGRINLEGKVPQMGLALDKELGARYRPIGFAIGNGRIRARQPSFNRQTGATDVGRYSDMAVLPPRPGTYEDVLSRASTAAFWLDARALPADTAGAWLHGPHPIRLISDVYVPQLPDSFETPIELPKSYDAILFVKDVTPARGE
ncbi:MAG TPA: erythromycin esterase family protein [Gemmatimonadaceae bacterium]|nr:erythromycin esterase family protein [Gemmatimonadaceae bacterium]